MECCGENRSTNFCPDCGKQLRDPNPLREILKHCKQQAIKCLTELQYMRDKYPDREHRIRSINKRLEKWERWAGALEMLVENYK